MKAQYSRCLIIYLSIVKKSNEISELCRQKSFTVIELACVCMSDAAGESPCIFLCENSHLKTYMALIVSSCISLMKSMLSAVRCR